MATDRVKPQYKPGGMYPPGPGWVSLGTSEITLTSPDGSERKIGPAEFYVKALSKEEDET